MNARPEKLSPYLANLLPSGLLRGPEVIDDVAARWQENHRVWHGPDHLLSLIGEIEAALTGEERVILLLSALYHDAVYDPRASDNEEASAALLLDHARDASAPVIRRAAEIIRDSKWTTRPEDELTRRFFQLDTRQLSADCTPGERLDYERAIFREYQFAPWDTYRTKRREFLEGWKIRFPEHTEGVEACLNLLEHLKPRVALYPGSFNPFHLGHLSILRQAEAAFDKVLIGLGINRQKAGSMEAMSQRQADLQARLRYHEVAEITGLVTHFVEAFPLPLTIVRGIRDGTDLEAELRYARFLNELRPGTNVVWIGCEPQFQHLSSSSIRELDSIEPGAGARYVPEKPDIYHWLPR